MDAFLKSVDPIGLVRTLKAFEKQDSDAYHAAMVETLLKRMAPFRSTFESRLMHGSKCNVRYTPLIMDTGASSSLTPFRSDFIDYVECNIPVKDVTKVNTVIGIGTAIYKFIDENGEEVFIPTLAYHLPETDIRLFSPQSYHQTHGGFSKVTGFVYQMTLPGRKKRVIELPIDKCTNLPLNLSPFVTKEEQQRLVPHVKSALVYNDSNLDLFGRWNFEQTFNHYSKFHCPASLADYSNMNLNGPQRVTLMAF